MHKASTYFQILGHFWQSYECLFPENGKTAHQNSSFWCHSRYVLSLRAFKWCRNKKKWSFKFGWPPYLVFKFFLPSYFFGSRLRCYRVSNSCSNVLISMILFGKKRECQSFDVCPRQHLHNFCYLMTLLVREVLSAKLILRYKNKLEAIL